MSNTAIAKAKIKVTMYITLETAEALRDYSYIKHSKNSHVVESALREFLGLKNN